MAYNLGYVGTAYNLGYTGTYTGGGVTYPYVLTSHGAADPNSIMADANFATTGTVELRIVSDFDPAKMVVDWQAMSDSQLWRDDINTLNAVTVNATSDTTDSAVIGWKTPDGTTGQFIVTVNIDGTAPTVLSVSATANGSYKAGDTLSLTVAANENVTVVTTGGTPYVPVTIGSTVRQFTYASGSGTQSLVFSYTIQAGDNDANGVSVGSSITANGATLKDAAGNALVLTLNSVADTSGILVDTVKPVITPDGNDPYTHIEGTTYNDPGATAVDDQDGTIGTVTGTHSIDENTVPGEYTVTYSGTGVTDTAGNEADDATRTVVVIAVSASAGGRRAFMRSCVRSSVKSSMGDFKA